MQKPQLPFNENQRIKTLQSLHILDTAPEYRFDRITQLLSNVFQVPIALVSLVDANRQWFKSCAGLDAKETPRDISFCGHAILDDNIFVIENALEDERFCDNPLVKEEPHIRFYAGYPLKHANGSNLGTLCLIDREPRIFSEQDRNSLKEFAALVELELVQMNEQSIDSETGLTSQDGFIQLANNSLEICRRLGLSVSVAFLYIKGLMSLKADNDEQDYIKCLNVISETFKVTFRSSDIVARYDDSSFIALLSNQNADTTQNMLHDLQTLLNHKLKDVSSAVQLTLTTGYSELSEDEDLQTLIFNAFDNLHA